MPKISNQIKSDAPKVQVVYRSPAAPLHNWAPQDKVELLSKRSDMFDEGNVYSIRAFNPRNPNIVQLENDDGETTFESWHNLRMDERLRDPVTGSSFAEEGGADSYLRWP